MSDENENNLTQDWPYRVPELSHEERIIELTKYIFEPLENFDFFTETHLAKHLMVGTEVHWNEGDDVSRPYSFDLMHFERAIIELDALLKSYPSPEEVITGLEDISLIKGDLLQHLELINNINDNLIPSLNDHLLELQENIKDHSEELFILETVQAVAPPVPKNYIYTQYQDQKLPTKLWPASRWAEVGVSADYTLWRCQAMADNHTLMLIIFARKLYGLELRFEAMFPDFVMPTPEQEEPEGEPEEGEDIEQGELENAQMQRARVNELEGEEGEGENTEPEDGQDIEEGELEGEPEEREEELRFIDLNARIVALNELLDDELLRKEQEEPEEEDGEGEEDGETEEGELELEQLLALYAPLNADEEEGELEPEEGEGETEEGEQGTTSNLAKLFAWCAHLEQRIMHALPEQEEPEEEDGEGEPESPQEPEEEGENPKEEGEEDLDNQ